ncbi:MAG: ATP-binding protein [Thermoplasmata archaeon]
MNDERKRRYLTVIPSARRLINSLRNLRYDYVKAVADIIDNSIQAGAHEIDVQMKFEGEFSWVRIADNGRGMMSDELTEAMRLGTNRAYEKNELGRFGLGLKTASISQCRRLTVASRSAISGSQIEVRRLDLNEIEESDKWEITDLPPEQCSPKIIDPIKSSNGTVVFWEFLDRMMKYKIPTGAAAAKRFNEMARDLENHLSMVFHRFLSGEVEGRSLKIKVNGNQLKPWDPFARSERTTLFLDESTIDVQGPGGVYTVRYGSYVLPNMDNFSSREAFDYYGRGRWNELQGFYIYRENRLIQYGGWNNMRASDEHTKFARIGLYFTAEADVALDLDVRKSSIDLPENLIEALRPVVAKVTSTANRLYRSSGDFESFMNSQPRETDVSSRRRRQHQSPLNGPESNTVNSSARSGDKLVTSEPNAGDRNVPAKNPEEDVHRLAQQVQDVTSTTEIRLSSLKHLFLSVLVIASERTGDSQALEAILREIKVDFPAIALLLGL